MRSAKMRKCEIDRSPNLILRNFGAKTCIKCENAKNELIFFDIWRISRLLSQYITCQCNDFSVIQSHKY